MNTPAIDLDDGDELAALFGGAPVAAQQKQPPASYTPPIFNEPCPKCRGTGKFVGYTGRVLGNCFTCKGAGTRTFKSSADDRQRNRSRAASRRADRAQQAAVERAQSAADFEAANKTEIDYLRAASRRNTERGGDWTFPQELLNKLNQYGSLTDGQLGAVRKMIARDAERATQRAEIEANAPAVDMTKIEAAFTRASAKLRSPRLQVSGFTIYPAKANSRNAGSLYVKDGDLYLGRITAGRFVRSLQCTPAQESSLLTVAADPAKAATEYGKLTGRCACCGLTLTNPASIERGIGPICAEKFGF